MAEHEGRGTASSESSLATVLGAFILEARQASRMSLRDVEEATKHEVSSEYLNHLESGEIANPSPRVLYALSETLRADYEALMQRAGYHLPNAHRCENAKPERMATYSIDNLTADEESRLREYLTFLRTPKRR